jgi:competence protein ComEA
MAPTPDQKTDPTDKPFEVARACTCGRQAAGRNIRDSPGTCYDRRTRGRGGKVPGVYILKKGQRVYEAVVLAEPEEHADLDRLNLAAVLKDSQRIIVPRKGEALGQGSDAYSDRGEGYGAGSGSSRPATGMPLFPLNVNTASQKELEALPGIGQALARAIVDYTERVGPFEKLEDLLNVSGIGEKVLAKISAYVVVE